MKESSFWRSLKKGLEKASNNKIFLQRIEDKFAKGIPDVHYCYGGESGWIELKWLAKYPKKITCKHFTAHQKLWLFNYWNNYHGRSWLLLRIKKDTYLIPGYAVQALHMNDVDFLPTLSDYYVIGKIDYDALFRKLVGKTWINS